jgi:hypothetical protein
MNQLPTTSGHHICNIKLPCDIRDAVARQDWLIVDQWAAALCAKGGELFNLLSQYAPIERLEHMIAVREPPDEEGIWHDDGSRLIAFSLSLIERPETISGGRLRLKKRGSEIDQAHELGPYLAGTLVIFATGVSGWEHCVEAVSSGRRIVLAGWGS